MLSPTPTHNCVCKCRSPRDPRARGSASYVLEGRLGCVCETTWAYTVNGGSPGDEDVKVTRVTDGAIWEGGEG